MLREGHPQTASMKARCPPGKWLARVDLDACYRVVTMYGMYGMFDMMANHMSTR